MILNSNLFGDSNPFHDSSQNLLLKIMSLIRNMASCEQRNALVIYVSEHIKMKKKIDKELLGLIYSYRDYYKPGSIGYINLDKMAQEVEVANRRK